MKITQKWNKLFLMGIAGMMLVFGLVGCGEDGPAGTFKLVNSSATSTVKKIEIWESKNTSTDEDEIKSGIDTTKTADIVYSPSLKNTESVSLALKPGSYYVKVTDNLSASQSATFTIVDKGTITGTYTGDSGSLIAP
ncbi:hypothetical protein FACS1894164_00110 [Spirochaetia bacterium]|nr:hypothetical protein FACS1894164_00110 [Spirochaetia bacterium]